MDELLPMAVMAGRAKLAQILTNWSCVLIGSVLFVIAVSNAWQPAPAGVAQRVVALAEAKTLAYAAPDPGPGAGMDRRPRPPGPLPARHLLTPADITAT
jgi:hypothetical protein